MNRLRRRAPKRKRRIGSRTSCPSERGARTHSIDSAAEWERASPAGALKEQGYEIDRRRIVLREPIKRFGNYQVPVRLHRDVTVELPVSVLSEGGIEIDVSALDAEIGGETPPQDGPAAEAAAENNE